MSYMDTGGYDGFSSSQANGGGGNFASPSQGTLNQYGGAGGSGGKGGIKRDPQTLVPVTIKQILDAQDVAGKFHIDGRPVSQVRVVGNVLQCNALETHTAASIEDGSGTTSAKLYHDNLDQAPQLIEGQYRMFVGKLVKIGGTIGLTAFAALPIDDSNQITAHYLDVILAHKRATGQPRAPAGGVAGAAGGAAAAAAANGNRGAYGAGANGYKSEYGNEVPQQNGGYGHGGGMAIDQSGSVRDQVLQAFASGPDAATDGGCSVSQVAASLSHLSFAQVQEAIQQLSNDGHLYSTIDEEHYKTTAQ